MDPAESFLLARLRRPEPSAAVEQAFRRRGWVVRAAMPSCAVLEQSTAAGGGIQ
jgi:hypothetical protein